MGSPMPDNRPGPPRPRPPATAELRAGPLPAPSMHASTAEERDFDCAGMTASGEHFPTISSMWQRELPPETSPAAWYQKSEAYWSAQSASVEGMLGGLDALHRRDVAASKRFIINLNKKTRRTLDVGAGIGRVTKALLAPLFDKVDMLEQSQTYVAESHTYLHDTPHVDRRFICGMQEFCARGFVGRDGVKWQSLEGEYDVIWVQWCIIYLTDDHFVRFFQECAKSLAEDGVICVKDNVARKGFLVDNEDSSVMRSDIYMRHLFSRAGLKVLKEIRQMNFPSSIYPVRTYALQPFTGDEPSL